MYEKTVIHRRTDRLREIRFRGSGRKVAENRRNFVGQHANLQRYDRRNRKITPEEQQGVTHHLIDFVNPKDSFSVAEYREKALPIIDELLKNGKTPIISGGTGLYVNGILYPMNFSDTSKDDKLRKNLENEYDEKGADFMHEKLAALDEKSALKIHKNDKKRVVRALEINLTHGNRDENDMKKPSYEYEMIGLSGGDRAVLYDRINKRVDKMFENGLVDEVKSLINTGVSFDCQSMQAIGYKEFKGFFDGILSENDLKELIKKTREITQNANLPGFGNTKILNGLTPQTTSHTTILRTNF